MMSNSSPQIECPVIINDSSLANGIVHKEFKTITSNFYWHQIIVNNTAGYTRDCVLRAIMLAVKPHDFIPVAYKTLDDGQVSFLVKNCSKAIFQLCSKALMVPNPDKAKNHMPFKVTIVLKYAHSTKLQIEIQSNILQVLRKRYVSATKTMNLEQFYKDADLTEFCPLSQQKLLYFVLHLANDFAIDTLKLGNNEIETLRPLEICGDRGAKSISGLDLKKNCIKDEEQLKVLKKINLTELSLEENPICDELTEHQYLKMARSLCPRLAKLDGLKLPFNLMISMRRNFLCNASCQDLVNRFLDHYFTLYDSPDRAALQGLYHKNAMFSLTQNYLSGQLSSLTTKLVDFKPVSRNIKLITDLSKSQEQLYVGPASIAKVLLGLPHCQHDPYTFTVDVTYYTEKMLVIVVTGVFKQPGINLKDTDSIFGFMRTFVLVSAFNDEYNITNEQMHVFNATTPASSRAFKVIRVPQSQQIAVPQAKNQSQREEMITALMLLTDLKHEWAKKCLTECDYDLKRSLNLFVVLFKDEKLPVHAFSFKASQKTESSVQHSIQQIVTTPKTPESELISAPEIQTPIQQPPVPAPAIQTPKEHPPPPIEPPQPAPPLPPQPAPPQPAPPQPAPPPSQILDPAALEQMKKLRKIKDLVLLNAMDIPKDLPMDQVRTRLMAAEQRILTTYTYANKYYKNIGFQFYRYGFVQEGRSFMSKGLAHIPKHTVEQHLVLNIRYEAEYGDWEHADYMMESFIKVASITRVVGMISTQLSFFSIERARNWLIKLSDRDMPDMDHQVVVNALTDFADKHGPHPHPEAQPHEEVIHISDECLPESDDLQEDIPPMDFWLFRTKILKLAGMYVSNIEDEELDRLRTMADPVHKLLPLCEQLLEKHNSEYGVLRLVCKTFWCKKMFKRIRQTLTTYKDVVDQSLMNNLIILYKLKTDAMIGDWKSFEKKLLIHMGAMEKIPMLNFLEDVIYEEPEFVK